MLGTTALSIALCAQQAAAVSLGDFMSYFMNGKYHGWFAADNTPAGQSSSQRVWASHDPTSSPLACDDHSSSITLNTLVTVAGSAVTAYWNNQWLHNTGPVITYLAQCPGSTCIGVDPNSLKWFKIDEAGLLSGTVFSGQWAAGKMITQNSSWTSTIPSSVPRGSYLIRFEIISLNPLPAQSYPACAQIKVTGGGSRVPTSSEWVSFPGAYRDNDPGLTIDVRSQAAKTQTVYIIPGPPLYGTIKSVRRAPQTATAGTSVWNGPTSTAALVYVPHWDRCGGIGYSGSGVCNYPWVCTYVNDYYSQCL